ncbi:DNA-3-methyladenine glycosylase I [Paraglaciecola aquimarina]|uniref:DNA-3-methyladenine glycosylase I n=1 Tax=Paraglaciecola aquimarina TaxID=1235557 RepID=A0ABU3SU31_9ALTE|nr:DNA-3-methyladenine glycosylase I [Paraglaciecola aquimarina]MDU0353521.1 DNA-3-methyladenine glycosylase I [Paraglaciecola aquimarina]
MSNTFLADDGTIRCSWCQATEQYIDYHDNEWGYPVADDQTLFEKICLEGFQSGLSWYTILVKRENFRKAFANFDFDQVASFTQQDVERLVVNAGIIRHRGKITATINNAKRAQDLIKEFGSLASYFWQFEPKRDESLDPEILATCPESVALSKDLKKRGWKFVGPTTMYAFMQAMGMVNDHALTCVGHEKSRQLRLALVRP